MRPDMLRVDGVPPETRQALQAAAQRLYGRPSASLLVRQLIAAHLAKSAEPPAASLAGKLAGDTVRVELRLPREALDKINALAERELSTRNYYLTSIILAHLGLPQLQGAEIEVLRRSNYEMAKIGTNLNQVARAFNTLVMMQGNGHMPEVGKKIASLRREISNHTGKVLRVLNAGTAIWEQKGRSKTGSKKSRN